MNYFTRENKEEIKENEKLLAEEREKDMQDRDTDFMTNALRTIVQLRGTSEAYTKEINEIKTVSYTHLTLPTKA